MRGYDEWKNWSPDDEYIPPDERPEGCECSKRIGDSKWCPVHGLDPDEEYEKQRERLYAVIAQLRRMSAAELSRIFGVSTPRALRYYDAQRARPLSD